MWFSAGQGSGMSGLKHRRGYDADSDDSDDDDYAGGGEFFPSDSSSTDTDDSREARARHYHHPRVLQERGTPPWYKNQPFRYNGRTAMIAIPGFILVLVLGGDMYVTWNSCFVFRIKF